MYLNVLLLSDITLPLGQLIDAAAYVGKKDALHSTSYGLEVKQIKPNDKAWAEWRRCLNLLCLRTTAHTAHTLLQPLGAWIVYPNAYTHQWDLYYSATTDAIYRSTALGYSVHKRIRYDYDKDSHQVIDDLPPDAIPIDRKETAYTWIRPIAMTSQDICPPPDAVTSVTDFFFYQVHWHLGKGICYRALFG